jgi:hypothetical protein
MTQRNTPETLHFLKSEHDMHTTRWPALCLKLQRSARNLPGVFPSAFAAMQGTPMSDRVHDPDEIQAGMVGYADDPNDSNKFGHIFCFRVKQADGTWLVWTNDAFGRGGVYCVDWQWFKRHWGDDFVFASKSLNGFGLILPKAVERKNPSPKPRLKATPDNLDYAVHRLQKSKAYHQKHDHPRYVKALDKEIADIRAIQEGKLT